MPYKRSYRASGPQFARNQVLYRIWNELREEYFPDRADLKAYQLDWSRRPQKRTLASCNIRTLKVLVARELDRDDCVRWLYPLLYHEMCHAFLRESVRNQNGKNRWHGAEFKELERKHPEIKNFDSWIKQGGWKHVVLSDRARRAHQNRKTKFRTN